MQFCWSSNKSWVSSLWLVFFVFCDKNVCTLLRNWNFFIVDKSPHISRNLYAHMSTHCRFKHFYKNFFVAIWWRDIVIILRCCLVRLPTLVNQMALSKCRRSIVLRHLALFITYLEKTRDFWFTDVRPSTTNPLTSLPHPSNNNNHRPRPPSFSRTVSGSSSANSLISSHLKSNKSLRPSTSTVMLSRRLSASKPRTTSQSSSIHSRRSSTVVGE